MSTVEEPGEHASAVGQGFVAEDFARHDAAAEHPVLGQTDSLQHLLWVVRQMRTHCPWTSALEHQDLSRYLVEEAEEATAEIEAGITGDPLRDELGDVLLQVVLNAAVAEDHGEFRFDDVAAAIAAKLIRRSPHVFTPDGELAPQESSLEEIDHAWQRIKAAEKRKAQDAADTSEPNTA